MTKCAGPACRRPVEGDPQFYCSYECQQNWYARQNRPPIKQTPWTYQPPERRAS